MNVLIVDDDVATVEDIYDSISWDLLGIKAVDTAHNVSGARQILSSKQIDIVISDIEMPQGSGIELLDWIRKENIECEFILLTCHENFSYAANALKLKAAEYLVKPFNAAAMELALKSVIRQIEQERSLQKNSQYGKWLANNPRQMKLTFWSDLFSGKMSSEAEAIDREIIDRNLDIDSDSSYCLVLAKMTGTDQDEKNLGTSLMQFSFENFMSEIVCANIENEQIVRFGQAGKNAFLAAVPALGQDELRGRCEFLLNTCGNHFKSAVTCCISNSRHLHELQLAAEQLADILTQNISYHGQVFTEDEAAHRDASNNPVLDIERISGFLVKREKTALLNYLKTIIRDRQDNHKLSEQLLHMMKQELLQSIYAYITPRGISASRLFMDPASESVSVRATQSPTDMLRWVNYVLEKIAGFEDEIKKNSDIIERINAYIGDHYMEDIGRNEIAAEFYLAPEYLSRLYRKKTGKLLKDYINEYRINKAKQLLQNEELLISDIAEAVGFSSFSYFSTMFKKYENMSPNDYRKEN